MPFAACSRRFVTMQSTLLFHPIRWQSEENVRLEEASEWARHFKQLESELDQLLAKMFDCPLETSDPLDAARPICERAENGRGRPGPT